MRAAPRYPPSNTPRVAPNSKPSRAMIEKAVCYFLGSRGRVWKQADGTYQIGRELNPGREILGKGVNLVAAFADTFMEPPSPAEAAGLTDANDTAQKLEDDNQDTAPGQLDSVSDQGQVQAAEPGA